MGKNQPKELTLDHILQELDQCADLKHRSFPELAADLVYFQHSVDNTLFTQEILEPFSRIQLPEVERMLQQSQFVKMSDPKTAVVGILDGNVAVFHRKSMYLLNISGPEERSVQSSETETVIAGPHDAFVESASTNLSLIRRRLKSPHLKVRKYAVGEISKTAVYVLYIEEIADMDMVEDLEQRIRKIETDELNDGGKLTQFIEDQPNSVFPQFLTTERPDVVVSKLAAGRVIAIVDNSPTAISAPASFLNFSLLLMITTSAGRLARPCGCSGFWL